MMKKTVKCVVVGDGDVGKTCLSWSYRENEFPNAALLTVLDNFVSNVWLDGKEVDFCVCDTPTGEDYDRLRTISYVDTDVFLICFSLVCPVSFTNVREYWYPEIIFHCPRIPYILVGTKLDLREDSMYSVSVDNGVQMAQDIGAAEYMECSALTVKRVSKVFEKACQVGLAAKKENEYYYSGRRRKKCAIV